MMREHILLWILCFSPMKSLDNETLEPAWYKVGIDIRNEEENVPSKTNPTSQQLYCFRVCLSGSKKAYLSGKGQGFHCTDRNHFFSFSFQWDIFFVYFRQGNTLNLKDSPKFMCSWFGPGLVVLLKSDLIMLALRLSVDYWYKWLLGGGEY